MIVLDLLYKLFIGPLELFFEVVYACAYRLLGDPALAIIALSLAMNFLVLPLYRRADAVQEEQRERAMRMKPWNDHIKAAFTGDERFMMQQAYNRISGWSPTDSLKGSVSLLLEIPFFIAAYRFLSGLDLLRGVPFGPIADLGAPDALLSIGGTTINILPIIMTAINLLSAAIYMKGMPTANKVQMIGVAAIFLVLLYNSPSGLVFYWTLNNLFSLVKNICYKVKLPKLPLGRLRNLPIPAATKRDDRMFLATCIFMALLTGALIPASVVGASPAEFVDLMNYRSPLWDIAGSLALAVGTFVLWFGVFYRLATPKGRTIFGIIMLVACVASVLNYLFFGTDYGNLSPQLEFDRLPVIPLEQALLNIGVILLAAAALVLLWRFKRGALRVGAVSLCVAVLAAFIASAVGIENNLVSVKPASAAQDAGSPHITLSRSAQNVVVIMLDRAIGAYVPFLMHENPQLEDQYSGFTYYPNTTSYGAFTNSAIPALYGGSEYRPEQINARSTERLEDKQNECLKVMPRIFAEHGFDVTVFDPTYAGYSWVPDVSIYNDVPGVKAYVTMDGQFLNDEALLSGDQGEQEVPVVKDHSLASRTFFSYSLFKTAPLFAQPVIYDEGRYNSTVALSALNATSNAQAASAQATEGQAASAQAADTQAAVGTQASSEQAAAGTQASSEQDAAGTQATSEQDVTAQATTGAQAWEGPVPEDLFITQTREGASVGVGVDRRFTKSYGVLQALPSITNIVEGDQGQFLMMSNDTTHEPMILAEPSYTPALKVDNTAFDEAHRVRYDKDGNSIEFPEESGDREMSKIMHYQINMAALMKLGDWFDYLRDLGVWDNTRIIIVSDHSRELWTDPRMGIDTFRRDGSWLKRDMLSFNSILLVKDFNTNGFSVSEDFMTTADTPPLAFAGVIENPINPFSGNLIDMSYKNEPEQHIIYSPEWDVEKNNGNILPEGFWYSVHDDVRDINNWKYLGDY